jgi:chaperonin GroES
LKRNHETCTASRPRPRPSPAEAEVIAVVDGVRKETGELIPMAVKAGDRVLFGKWSGTEVKI